MAQFGAVIGCVTHVWNARVKRAECWSVLHHRGVLSIPTNSLIAIDTTAAVATGAAVSSSTRNTHATTIINGDSRRTIGPKQLADYR
jgi:hypothetical protein